MIHKIPPFPEITFMLILKLGLYQFIIFLKKRAGFVPAKTHYRDIDNDS